MLWLKNRTWEIEIMEVWVASDDKIYVMVIKSIVEDEGRMWDKIIQGKEIYALRSQCMWRIMYIDIENTMKDEKALLETMPLCLIFRPLGKEEEWLKSSPGISNKVK